MEMYLREIAEKASTLTERLNGDYEFKDSPESVKTAWVRMKELRKTAAVDEEGLLRKRLAWDNLSMEKAEQVFGSVKLKKSAELPEWTAGFGEILKYLKNFDRPEAESCFGPGADKEIPFFHLLAPIAAYAREKLEQDKMVNLEKISQEAIKNHTKNLLRRLSGHFSQTLILEFSIYRQRSVSPFSRLMEFAADNHSSEVYSAYVNRMFDSGWEKFFAEYSVLAKSAYFLTDYWISNTKEFMARLNSDHQEIVQKFYKGKDTGQLLEMTGGLSDSHNGGKSVFQLKFESGLKLIYKPKSIDLEEVYFKILENMNKTGLENKFRILTTVNRDHYGWVEFIEPDDCTNEEEVERFYKRTGMLLCLIYVLNGNDFHFENIIASGEQPVYVDLETIMHHMSKDIIDGSVDNAVFQAFEQFGASVFRSGLLPQWLIGRDGASFDVSGIGYYGEQETPFKRLSWEYINSDTMRTVYKPAKFSLQNNLPVLNGDVRLPDKYPEKILEGFSELYRFIIKNRDSIPFHLFKHKTLRFIFRATRIYGAILMKTLNPAYLRCGINRSIQYEALARAFIYTEEKNPHWKIFKSEIRQMENYDIPYFSADSSGMDVNTGAGETDRGMMTGAVYGQVIKKLAGLNENDLKNQKTFIKAALFIREIEDVHSTTEIKTEKNSPMDYEPAGKEKSLNTSKEIAGRLENTAIVSSDGSANWISVGLAPEANRYLMQPMSNTLYDGRPGPALLFSALYSVAGEEKYKNLAYSAIESIRRSNVHTGLLKGMLRQAPAGIASGLTSTVYSLQKMAGFLQDDSLLEEALKVAGYINHEKIDSEKAYDIIAGSAGALLGFLNLYKTTGDKEILSKARYCGEHLIKNSIQNESGGCGWKTISDEMLSGFSHGAAGIAYSLLKLYEATGEEKFFRTGEDAIKYETTLYSPEDKNWLDIRKFDNSENDEKKFMTAWCHGAAGIGLARTAALDIMDNGQIREDINSAIDAVKEYNRFSPDHLCCGRMGRADFLLYAGKKLRDKNLTESARRLSHQVYSEAAQAGKYRVMFSDTENFYHPGFFQGMSGIGYEFLRMAEPDKVPSILLFE